MTDTQATKYFYSDAEQAELFAKGPQPFRLPPESFPQHVAREKFWNAYRTRQALWVAASSAVFSGLLMDDVLQKNAVYQKQQFNQVSDFEYTVFGRAVTQGSIKDRAQFWHFVAMQFRGITPSDLLTLVDTIVLESEENQAVQVRLAEAALPGGKPFPAGIAGFERDIRKNKGPNTFYRAKVLRRWANLYLNNGYPTDYLTQAITHLFPIVLCKPFPKEQLPEDTSGKTVFTLGFLHLYFIEQLRDIAGVTPAAQTKVVLIVPVVFPQEMTKNFKYDAAVAAATLDKVLSVYNNWPKATKSRLTEMAARGASAQFYSAFHFTTSQMLDNDEIATLGEIITAGNLPQRQSFWKIMQAVAAGATCMEEVLSFISPQSIAVRESAMGYIEQGHGLEELTRLLDYGRQGLNDPIKEQDRKEVIPAEERYKYRTLAYWISLELK